MNAGNGDKHRLIAHRQERLGTERTRRGGSGVVRQRVQKQDGWKWGRSWTDASQGPPLHVHPGRQHFRMIKGGRSSKRRKNRDENHRVSHEKISKGTCWQPEKERGEEFNHNMDFM